MMLRETEPDSLSSKSVCHQKSNENCVQARGLGRRED